MTVRAEAAARSLLRRVWNDLGRDVTEIDSITEFPIVPLPARLDVSTLAGGAVAAADLALGHFRADRAERPRLSGARIAASFSAERSAQIDGEPPAAWAPLSGFIRARDGWVRTHANYVHHAQALRMALGLATDASREDLECAVRNRPADDVARQVNEAGGACVVVALERPADDVELATHPLVELSTLSPPFERPPRLERGAHAARAFEGVRVLDLTRVVAGPVATRAFAQFGADVLRIDPPSRPEIEWQHRETGHGKRSTKLDLRDAADRAIFDQLLAESHVLAWGYRASALRGVGLDLRTIAKRHPGIVIAQLSAWGFGAADRDRRGFDSLVQAASGIALVEGDGGVPGALPAQALDHAGGYLLAAGIATALERSCTDGRSRRVRLSLRRVAAELLRMPRTDVRRPAVALDDAAHVEHAEVLSSAGARLRSIRPPFSAAGHECSWRTPAGAWGADGPQFATR